MTDRGLNVPVETAGEWFLPEEPSRVIPGILKYTPAHSELHLHEAFRPVRGAYRVGDTQDYPVILGSTTDGELVTVVKAQRAGFNFNIGSAGLRGPERVISTLVVIGAHLTADFLYREMSFRVPGLEVWLSRRVVEQGLPETDPDTKRMTTTYRVSGLPRETTRLDSVGATLCWETRSHHSSTPTTVSVHASAWIILEPDELRPIEWFLDQLQKATTLLGFLAGTGMSPDCISASIDESRHRVSVMVALRDAKYCVHTGLLDFFMTRGSMGTDVSAVVSKWFDIYAKVDAPSQLALSIFTSEKLWLHVKFLSLMQALEGFHRGLYNGNYMDETDYVAIKEVLINAIPSTLTSDHKDALRSKIRYGYQFSLRKRLNELAERLSAPVRKMILGGDGKVPGQWIDTRNYYTHWDEELRDSVLNGEGMYYGSVRMQMFLRVLYLDLVGIAESTIVAALGNASDISQHLIHLNIIERRRANPADESGVLMTLTEHSDKDDVEQSSGTREPLTTGLGLTNAPSPPASLRTPQRLRRLTPWALAVAVVLALVFVFAFR